MILGTWGGAFFGYHFGPWVGILGAILLGVVGGAIHAVATVIFGVDHIVSGVAINLLGAGAGAYLAVRTFTNLPGRWTDAVATAAAAAVHQRPGVLRHVGLASRRTQWWIVADLAGDPARPDDEPQRADHHRRRPARALVVGALADPLRAAAAVVRRGSAGRRDVGHQRDPLQVRRGAHLRRARRAGRRLPRPRRLEPLPRGPDRRSRLHRPRRDDLRQLASRRPRGRRRALRLRRRRPAARRRRRRPGLPAAVRHRPRGLGRLAARAAPAGQAGRRGPADRPGGAARSCGSSSPRRCPTSSPA